MKHLLKREANKVGSFRFVFLFAAIYLPGERCECVQNKSGSVPADNLIKAWYIYRLPSLSPEQLFCRFFALAVRSNKTGLDTGLLNI